MVDSTVRKKVSWMGDCSGDWKAGEWVEQKVQHLEKSLGTKLEKTWVDSSGNYWVESLVESTAVR